MSFLDALLLRTDRGRNREEAKTERRAIGRERDGRERDGAQSRGLRPLLGLVVRLFSKRRSSLKAPRT